MKIVPYFEFCMAMRELQDKVDSRISITDMGGVFDHPEVRLGVSWASFGTVPADEAVEFAKALTEASKAAKEFPYNGYYIEY